MKPVEQKAKELAHGGARRGKKKCWNQTAELITNTHCERRARATKQGIKINFIPRSRGMQPKILQIEKAGIVRWLECKGRIRGPLKCRVEAELFWLLAFRTTSLKPCFVSDGSSALLPWQTSLNTRSGKCKIDFSPCAFEGGSYKTCIQIMERFSHHLPNGITCHRCGLLVTQKKK